MSDYISREAAMTVVEAKQKKLCPVGLWGKKFAVDKDKYDVLQKMLDKIEAIPVADVEPVRHVRRKVWGIDEYYGEWLQCPRCLYSENASNAKYCGGCGARIDLALPEGDSHG
nr:MAG TPA: PROTEIN/RNA Complex, archaeal, ribosomal, 50S, protein.0A [Caudoviricetes sp.]